MSNSGGAGGGIIKKRGRGGENDGWIGWSGCSVGNRGGMGVVKLVLLTGL